MIDKDRHFSATRSRYWATAIAIAVLLLGVEATSWAAGASEAATAPAGQAERVATAPKEEGTIPGAPSMDQRYAARETSSKTLETFKGGDVVIIGSGALVIVLLVVLIIVII